MADGTPRYAPLDGTTQKLRWLCLIYVVLLVLEGALRKWVLPGFSNALLLARDPVVLLAYFIAATRFRFPKNSYIISATLLMAIWAAVTMIVGHKNLYVTLFGLRANFLHLPLAFIMGSVFYRSDVIIIGRWWLYGSLIMTGIIVMQFLLPQSAWINRGVGGVEGAGFSGAMGRFRPPGTFSFIVGVVWYYTFATAFLVAGITQHKRYPKWLLAGAAVAIIVAIPVSISRMLILSAALTFLVGLFASSMQKRALFRYARIILFTFLGLLVAGQFEVFEEAKEAFMARWEHSTSEDFGGVKGAIVFRIVNEFTGPFANRKDLPFLGSGIGAGTQVGNQMLTGTRGFQLGEGEWFRITAEGGVILGGLYILWRIALCLALGKLCFSAYRKGNGLAMILFSATAFNLLIGQFGQSTILGFTTIGIGLTAASLSPRKTIETEVANIPD